MPIVDVLALSELEQRSPKLVAVGRREIVLIRVDDEVHALRNLCPHESQSFIGGRVTRKVDRGTCVPGTVAMSADDLVLQCPWHQWAFDLRTGKCNIDSHYRVRRYTTEVKGDRVFVNIG